MIQYSIKLLKCKSKIKKNRDFFEKKSEMRLNTKVNQSKLCHRKNHKEA